MPVRLCPRQDCQRRAAVDISRGGDQDARASGGGHHGLAVLLAERTVEAALEVLREEVVEVRLATELRSRAESLKSAAAHVEGTWKLCAPCRHACARGRDEKVSSKAESRTAKPGRAHWRTARRQRTSGQHGAAIE